MDKIAIGKVRTSTGVRGYFKVLSFSGEIVHFKKLKGQAVEIRNNGRSKSIFLQDVKMSGANLTIKAEGIDTPEDAKMLSGWEIVVERDQAAALGKDEFYIADLCGCKLVYKGETVGDIKAVTENGISDILEVEVDGKVKMVPFLNRYIGDVDTDKGIIELTEGWLLE